MSHESLCPARWSTGNGCWCWTLRTAANVEHQRLVALVKEMQGSEEWHTKRSVRKALDVLLEKMEEGHVDPHSEQ
jgi:hypothetical protein